MFSGPGISAFFQPLRAAGPEAAPTQAITPLRKSGDEQKHPESFTGENTDRAENIPQKTDDGGEDAFAEDHTTLSIEALRRLLAHTPETGTGTASSGGAGADTAGDAQTREALAAYHRAEDVRPAMAVLPGMDSFVPPAKDRATAQDILMILAKLENAGVREIAVRDGASVYDTISAMCWSLSPA